MVSTTDYRQLVQDRADLQTKADGIFPKLQAAKTALRKDPENDELVEQVTSLTGDYDAVKAELKTVQAQIEDEEEHRDLIRSRAAKRFDETRDDSKTRISDVHDRREDDPMRGFANVADFALAVKSASRPGGYVDDRLRVGAAPTNFHQESGANEGYMVPPQMRDSIWELVFSGDDILNLVDPEPTSSNAVELDADETTPWGSTGVQANWRSEGTQMSATKLVTEHRQTRVHELYAFVTATDELLQDAPRLNDRLTRKSSQAIRYKASDSIVYGTGAGQPLGWFNSGALVTVAKESGQSADTISATNVAKMYSRLLSENIGRAFWMANSDTIPQLMTMTIGDQPIWSPPNGFVDAPGGILLGRPVRLMEHAKTLGDKGDITLVNPTGYHAVRRTDGMQAASSMHLFFDYGVTAFRWTFRFGGQPFLEAPVDPDNGTNTKSHFVTLAERA